MILYRRIVNTQKIIIPALAFLLLFCAPPLFAQEPVIEKVMDHGADESRLVLVVLGDGYREAEMQKYRQDVDNLLQGFFSVTPWAEYKKYINVYRIEVISNQSGSDHPAEGVYVDTVMDAIYNPPVDLFISSYKANALAQLVAGYDFILAVVNDSVYGASSGGKEVVVSTHSSMVEAALHEFGHTFAYLADEYEQSSAGASVMTGPNVTQETERDNIPWKVWIMPNTPIPTPEENAYSADVGLFEGAACHSTDIYRPRLNCRMRTLGVPFCQICIQAQILKLHAYTQGVIEEIVPSTSEVLYSGQDSLLFKLTLIDPNHPHLTTVWELDGIVQQQGGTEFTIETASLDEGQHIVKAIVKDVTALVREDPEGRLTSSRLWILKETNNPPAAPSNPSPPDGAVDQPLTSVILTWHGEDPDPSDALTYDVYFDQNNPPSSLVSANQSWTSYPVGGGLNPIPNSGFIFIGGGLSPQTTYYWQITAKDNFGGQTEGPVWEFTTAAPEPPPPPVTRTDIDLIIKDFKEENASEGDVKGLIDKYMIGE